MKKNKKVIKGRNKLRKIDQNKDLSRKDENKIYKMEF